MDADKKEFEKHISVVSGKENDYERFFAIWKAACKYKQKEIDDLKSMIKSAVLVYEEQLEKYRGKHDGSPPTAEKDLR
jgi:hypothetical protein